MAVLDRRRSPSISTNLAAGPFGTLFGDLQALDPTLPTVVDSVLSEIRQHEPLLLDAWLEAGLLDKVDVYTLYYLVPFHALMWPQPMNEPALLAAQLMSCLAWRAFDDAIDGHAPPAVAHAQSLAACTALIRFVTSSLGVSGADCARDVAHHYQLMAKQADRERHEPIPIDEIWSRCSIFLYAPETLARLNLGRIQLLRDYINYTGLAHDLSDIMSDIGSGVISLPIRWLSEVSDMGILNVTTIDQVYSHARNAVRSIEDRFATAEVATRHPTLHRLMLEARTVFNGR